MTQTRWYRLYINKKRGIFSNIQYKENMISMKKCIRHSSSPRIHVLHLCKLDHFDQPLKRKENFAQTKGEQKLCRMI